MSDWQLVDFDPFTGIAHYVQWREIDDAFRFMAVQEAEPIFKLNAERAAAAPTRHGDGLTHVASLTMPIWQELKTAGIIDDKKALARWLNDSDNRKFRTRSGKV